MCVHSTYLLYSRSLTKMLQNFEFIKNVPGEIVPVNISS